MSWKAGILLPTWTFFVRKLLHLPHNRRSNSGCEWVRWFHARTQTWHFTRFYRKFKESKGSSFPNSHSATFYSLTVAGSCSFSTDEPHIWAACREVSVSACVRHARNSSFSKVPFCFTYLFVGPWVLWVSTQSAVLFGSLLDSSSWNRL